jgi:AmmeMemoRadiSam system protein B
MDQRVDEDEHSGEMQYPYIAKMLSEAALSIDAVSVLPIMVGGIGVDKEIFFGKVMSSFLARNDIFTIISSDFCHWGKRFGYFPPHDKDYKSFVQQENCKAETKDISNYIQELDNLGMVGGTLIHIVSSDNFPRYTVLTNVIFVHLQRITYKCKIRALLPNISRCPTIRYVVDIQ